MNLNFFKRDCQDKPIIEKRFGVCNDQKGKKAYTNFDRPKLWIAEVKNENELEVVFTAIDKCVLFDNEHLGRGRCDAMLTTSNHLYLVKLKNQDPPWQSNAIEQLKSTIQFLLDNHDISKYKKRKALACNKKREKFVVIDNEFNKSFYRCTTFRIDIQAEIVIF